MKISVIIPVYNEVKTIDIVVARVINHFLIEELIIVDDCSTDGTKELLEKYKNVENVIIVHHEKNKGKGSAIKSALPFVTGDVIIIQDADLEYSPEEYYNLLQPIWWGGADFVNGSRFMQLNLSKPMKFWHYMQNWAITTLFNIVNNIYLTDVASCYKVFRKSVLNDITLTCDDFRFETELMTKIVEKEVVIYEVPISYNHRTKKDGKKLKITDGLKCALWLVLYAIQKSIPIKKKKGG